MIKKFFILLIAILPMVGSACQLDSQSNYRQHQVSKDYDEANEEGSTTHGSFQVEYEANKENGGLQVIKGTHKLGMNS